MPDDSVARPRGDSSREFSGELSRLAKEAAAQSDGILAKLAEMRSEPSLVDRILRPPIEDFAAIAKARRRAKEREIEMIVAAVVPAVIARLERDGYVIRNPGPLDPNRERISLSPR